VFKKVFYTQLLPELKARGKAVLVISHDERYFGMADRVLRLDYGKLAPNNSPRSVISDQPEDHAHADSAPSVAAVP
jgi:putative ATP-binding cassette transporter